jgi:hypothetical protein
LGFTLAVCCTEGIWVHIVEETMCYIVCIYFT